MNPLAFLSPYKWLIYGALIVAVVVGVPILWEHHNSSQQGIGYEKRAAEDKAAAEAQSARIRDLQQAAEKRYVVQAGVRDRFITETITEVRHVTESLAACPVPAAARGMLNAAAECASGDSPGACAAGQPVPAASAAR